MATLQGSEAVNQATGASVAATIASVQTGECLIACVQSREAVITGVSDATHGAWTQAVVRGHDLGGGEFQSAIYYVLNATAGSHEVTATHANSLVIFLSVTRWSGVATASAVDDTGSAFNDTVTSHSCGQTDSTTTGVVMCASILFNYGSTKTPATDFTALSNGGDAADRNFNQYRIIASGTYSGTATFTSSSSNSGVACTAAFKDAGGTDIPRAPGSGSLQLAGAAPSVLKAMTNDARIIIRRA